DAVEDTEDQRASFGRALAPLPVFRQMDEAPNRRHLVSRDLHGDTRLSLWQRGNLHVDEVEVPVDAGFLLRGFREHFLRLTVRRVEPRPREYCLLGDPPCGILV